MTMTMMTRMIKLGKYDVFLAGFGSFSLPQDFFVSLLGSGVLVLHRIFSSPFWVRECQSSTGFFRLLAGFGSVSPPQDFFVSLLGSGVLVLLRIFSSPCWLTSLHNGFRVEV